jgi:hypothetical protein
MDNVTDNDNVNDIVIVNESEHDTVLRQNNNNTSHTNIYSFLPKKQPYFYRAGEEL